MQNTGRVWRVSLATMSGGGGSSGNGKQYFPSAPAYVAQPSCTLQMRQYTDAERQRMHEELRSNLTGTAHAAFSLLV
jgi:hypothetical protein